MKTSEKTVNEGRRSFLTLAAVAPVSVAAAAVGTEASAEEASAETGTGLRDTPHVRAYLDSARF